MNFDHSDQVKTLLAQLERHHLANLEARLQRHPSSRSFGYYCGLHNKL